MTFLGGAHKTNVRRANPLANWMTCGFLLAVVCMANLADAGTPRHDVSPDVSLTMGSSFESVGKFIGRSGSSAYLGSGTLISDNWVLTAGHNVDSADSLSFSIGGQDYSASSWIAHPGWDGDLMAGYDIALVQLDAPVANIAPAERYSGFEEMGAIATSVGYGKSGDGLSGAVSSAGTRRAGQNVIDMVTQESGGRVLLSDFDNPLDFTDNKLGSAFALENEYLIAPGDSGGGLFIDTEFGPMLAGVHSFGSATDGLVNSDYGDVSGHIRVSAFNDWIDSIIYGDPFGDGSTLEFADGLFANGVMSSITPSPVPEPATLGIAALMAIFGLALGRRTLRRKA